MALFAGIPNLEGNGCLTSCSSPESEKKQRINNHLISYPGCSKLNVSNHKKKLFYTEIIDKDLENRKKPRPACSVFIGSLPSYISEEKLLSAINFKFKEYGNVLFVKILKDPKKRSYAFVEFSEESEAQKAVELANNKVKIFNRFIRCENAKVNRTLIVKDFFPDANSDIRLFNTLKNIGELEIIVPVNTNTESFFKKEWLVQFAFREDALLAIGINQNQNIYSVEWSSNLDDDAKQHNIIPKLTKMNLSVESENNNLLFENNQKIDLKSIFIGQLHQKITVQDIYSKFSKHGKILSINLFNKNPKNCYCFLKFNNNRSASFAIEAENHTLLKDKIIHVQCREFFHIKSDKKLFLQKNINMKTSTHYDFEKGKNQLQSFQIDQLDQMAYGKIINLKENHTKPDCLILPSPCKLISSKEFSHLLPKFTYQTPQTAFKRSPNKPF